MRRAIRQIRSAGVEAIDVLADAVIEYDAADSTPLSEESARRLKDGLASALRGEIGDVAALKRWLDSMDGITWPEKP